VCDLFQRKDPVSYYDKSMPVPFHHRLRRHVFWEAWRFPVSLDDRIINSNSTSSPFCDEEKMKERFGVGRDRANSVSTLQNSSNEPC